MLPVIGYGKFFNAFGLRVYVSPFLRLGFYFSGPKLWGILAEIFFYDVPKGFAFYYCSYFNVSSTWTASSSLYAFSASSSILFCAIFSRRFFHRYFLNSRLLSISKLLSVTVYIPYEHHKSSFVCCFIE